MAMDCLGKSKRWGAGAGMVLALGLLGQGASAQAPQGQQGAARPAAAAPPLAKAEQGQNARLDESKSRAEGLRICQKTLENMRLFSASLYGVECAAHGASKHATLRLSWVGSDEAALLFGWGAPRALALAAAQGFGDRWTFSVAVPSRSDSSLACKSAAPALAAKAAQAGGVGADMAKFLLGPDSAKAIKAAFAESSCYSNAFARQASNLEQSSRCVALNSSLAKEGGLSALGFSCAVKKGNPRELYLMPKTPSNYFVEPRSIFAAALAASRMPSLPGAGKGDSVTVPVNPLTNPSICLKIQAIDAAEFGKALEKDGGLDKVAPKNRNLMQLPASISLAHVGRFLDMGYAAPNLSHMKNCPDFDQVDVSVVVLGFSDNR